MCITYQNDSRDDHKMFELMGTGTSQWVRSDATERINKLYWLMDDVTWRQYGFDVRRQNTATMCVHINWRMNNNFVKLHFEEYDFVFFRHFISGIVFHATFYFCFFAVEDEKIIIIIRQMRPDHITRFRLFFPFRRIQWLYMKLAYEDGKWSSDDTRTPHIFMIYY